MIELDVKNPDYLDHFFMDSSEYSAYPEEGEVVVGEYNIYKILSVEDLIEDDLGYVKFVLEPQPHSKSDWINMEQNYNSF